MFSRNPVRKNPVTGEFQRRDTRRAKELRQQASPAERTLWQVLSNRKLGGFKFSRQMPIGPYFADFLCREARLIVEIDGYSHDMRIALDLDRDAYLVSQGYRVLRFSNADVLTNLDGVAEGIALALEEVGPPPAPPASGRGDSETRPLC